MTDRTLPLWRKGILFGCAKLDRAANEEQLQPFLTLDHNDLSVLNYNTIGMITSSQLVHSLLPKKMSNADHRVTAAGIRVRYVSNVIIVTVISVLTEEFTEQLLIDGPRWTDWDSTKRYSDAVRGLIVDLVPPLKVENRRPANKIDHVLYLEPVSPIAGGASPTGETNEATIKLIEDLGAHVNSVAPAILEDVILLDGFGSLNAGRSAIAVRLWPLPEARADVQVPLIPELLIHQWARCDVMDHYADELRRLMSNSDQYWQMSKRWSNFDQYRTEFLVERMKVSTLLLQADEAQKALVEVLPTGHIGRNNYVDLAQHFPSKDKYVRLLRGSFRDRLLGSLEASRVALEVVAERTQKRLDALDSYLRDAASTDAVAVNTSLNRNVRKMTILVLWVAIASLLIAVASLAIGILPDTAKENVIRAVAPQSAADWLLFGGVDTDVETAEIMDLEQID